MLFKVCYYSNPSALACFGPKSIEVLKLLLLIIDCLDGKYSSPPIIRLWVQVKE